MVIAAPIAVPGPAVVGYERFDIVFGALTPWTGNSDYPDPAGRLRFLRGCS